MWYEDGTNPNNGLVIQSFSPCNTNMWLVLQFWYLSGRFFDTIVTHSPIYQSNIGWDHALTSTSTECGTMHCWTTCLHSSLRCFEGPWFWRRIGWDVVQVFYIVNTNPVVWHTYLKCFYTIGSVYHSRTLIPNIKMGWGWHQLKLWLGYTKTLSSCDTHHVSVCD